LISRAEDVLFGFEFLQPPLGCRDVSRVVFFVFRAHTFPAQLLCVQLNLPLLQTCLLYAAAMASTGVASCLLETKRADLVGDFQARPRQFCASAVRISLSLWPEPASALLLTVQTLSIPAGRVCERFEYFQ